MAVRRTAPGAGGYPPAIDPLRRADASPLELVEGVRNLDYGRPSEPSVEAMLRERRGTCSTKHLFLAQALARHFPECEPQIVHRVYRLDRERARERFGEEVADTVPEAGLVDVHRYLTVAIAGERIVLDATFPGEPWDGRSSLPLACGPGQDHPAGADPDGEKRALEEQNCDPAVREAFIAALARAARPGPISRAGRNVELKARDADPQCSLAICESLGAEDRSVLKQRDTYFDAREGRLKLREEAGAAAQLIAYERPDLTDSRESRYRIVEVAQARELKAALSAALGVAVVVAKERRLFIWEGNVRIHLDAVEGLGSFIEFEAVAAADSDLSHEQDQARRLRRAFEIDDIDLIAGSYCDLALARCR